MQAFECICNGLGMGCYDFSVLCVRGRSGV